MEYLFNKEELKRMIDAPDSGNVVAIAIAFTCDTEKKQFVSEITARAAFRNPTSGAQVDTAVPPIKGCPNPPGCPVDASLLIMKAMNII